MCGLLAAGWLVMTTTHELGHVLFGWLSGATLVELKLWGLPHSFYEPDPSPAWTLWGGPVVGVVVPVVVAVGVSGLARLRARRGVEVVGTASPWRRAQKPVWFVADFCVLSNGVYLALAWVSGNPTLDTARLLDAGVHPGWIAAYCVATIGAGYVWFRRDVAAVLRPKPDDSPRPSAETHT
ncbi:MAG: hypothetical protein AAGE65_06360 [Planctomycetota bacterium]